ncbi:MAG: hypothetical protein KAX31_04210, partial [Thermoplasmata archaeon]|nr:hypothetical protein [Thermoplasmata archaeon]
MLIGSIYLISPNNARGVIVQINDLAPEYEKGDQIEIIADIIIESGERIPIDHMLLEIAGASFTNASFNV